MDRLSAMETFVCVVDSGSFSAAARVLNIGQPAVSKAIAQLEEHLGVQLLLRSTRGLMPTEAGQGYYEGALRAINETNQAELDARGVSSGLTGQLKICAAVTFARIHIVPHIDRFLAQNPGLTIDIVLDDRNIDLLENGVDVALRMGELSDSTMTAKKIAQSQRAVLATPAYFALHGEPALPEDLTSHEAIIYGRAGGGAVWSFRQDDAEVAIAVGGRIKVSAGEGVRAAVLANMGLAIASRWMFAPELADGSVRAVLTEWRLDPIDLWAVYPAGRKASAKARAFTAFVESIMADSN
jgi:DNA-binding transcriptional LysR family regulator